MSDNKTKTDLVDSVADKAGLSKTDAGKAVDAVLASVTEILKGGGDLTIIGFGKFSTVAKPAREGRNPSTGEAMQIKASNAPKFTPGKALKTAVNG